MRTNTMINMLQGETPCNILPMSTIGIMDTRSSDELIPEMKVLTMMPDDDDDENGLFNVKSANRWMELARSKPIPNMLFGELWYQGELCILFSDTNVGKSILAVQIADSLTKGNSILPFTFGADRQKVLYFDFELSEKQFENRYSINYNQHYQFSNNFDRSEINCSTKKPSNFQNFDDYLIFCLELQIIDIEATVLIIDNITYLSNQTKDGTALMKKLNSLKKKYGISILVLAHTPKRNLTKPITENDLRGSKKLMDFCDSAFTIGRSNIGKDIRYVKQVKQRSCEQLYGADNVCEFKISKPTNFLQFQFLDYSKESEHLKQTTDEDKEELLQDVRNLKSQGLSLREIGEKLGITHMKAKRILDR